MDRQIFQVSPMLIPIIAIVMGIGMGMLGLVLDYRKKRAIFDLHHKERMAAIEKGIEVPALPAELFQNPRNKPLTQSDYLRRGLLWLLAGIAAVIALYGRDHNASLLGLIPAAIGVAYLLFYWLEGRKPAQLDQQ